MNIFPAFASGGPGRSQHPWVNLTKAITVLATSGGKLKGVPPMRMLPHLTIDPTSERKLNHISQNTKQEAELSIFPADTLVYEIYNKDAERVNKQPIYDEFIRNIRRYTRQVWAGSAAPYTDSTSSCAFALTDERKGHGAVFYLGSTRTGMFQSIRLCTEEIWREAWRNAMAPCSELGVDIVHPAHHSMLSDPDHAFYLQAGITIERLKYRLWDKLRNSKSCSASQHRDALKNTSKPQRFFSEKLEEVCQRSLLKQQPETHISLRELWIARGIIAHGKKLPPGLASRDKIADLENLYKLARFVDNCTGVYYPPLIH